MDVAAYRWGPPITDIVHFLFFCMDPTVRRASANELLEHYHRELMEALSALSEANPEQLYPLR